MILKPGEDLKQIAIGNPKDAKSFLFGLVNPP